MGIARAWTTAKIFEITSRIAFFGVAVTCHVFPVVTKLIKKPIKVKRPG